MLLCTCFALCYKACKAKVNSKYVITIFKRTCSGVACGVNYCIYVYTGVTLMH